MLTTLKVVYYCVRGHTKIINMIFDIVQQFSSWCNSSLLPVRPPPYNAIAYHMHHSAHSWHYPIWESVECLLEILRFPPLLKTAATSQVPTPAHAANFTAAVQCTHCACAPWPRLYTAQLCSDMVFTVQLLLSSPWGRTYTHQQTYIETVSNSTNPT